MSNMCSAADLTHYNRTMMSSNVVIAKRFDNEDDKILYKHNLIHANNPSKIKKCQGHDYSTQKRL